jgi:hypothetical protein
MFTIKVHEEEADRAMLIAVIAERMFAQMRLTPPLFLIVWVKVNGTDSVCG